MERVFNMEREKIRVLQIGVHEQNWWGRNLHNELL